LGVPQHILRYWETRFAKLRPLIRAGNRRYYRPDDVALVRRIHHLLHVEGYTVKGVQKLLSAKADSKTPVPEPTVAQLAPSNPVSAAPAPTPPSYIPDLVLIRDRLKTALAAAGR
jgi:DNA-binding transcriptional MerR regulator